MVGPQQVIPSITAVRLTGARNRAELPLLVLGPSLGTSASTLWGGCATHLADVFDVLAWDLPGHGHNRAVPDEQSSVAELAVGVLRVVEDVLVQRGDLRGDQRGEVGEPFFHAGASVGGEVGLRLLLDAPDRVTSAVQLDDVTRLAPDEAPEAVARLLREHFLGEVSAEPDTGADGRDAATRPGLDLRERSLVTLTALVVGGHHEQLATHLRAARTAGLTVAEIEELLSRSAPHCDARDAGTALRVARQVLAEEPPARS